MTLAPLPYPSVPRCEHSSNIRRLVRSSATPLTWLLLSAVGMAACQPAQSERALDLEAVAAVSQPLSGEAKFVVSEPAADRFALATGGLPAPLVVAAEDHAGVVRAAKSLQGDLRKVTGAEAQLSANGQVPAAAQVVIIGTIGKSPLIDALIDSGKLNVEGIEGKWETFVLQVVDAPQAGVERALVIAGSDKRATIYGIYELSSQIGVSPWHYWADVPARQQKELHVLPGRHSLGEPKVKYRGFFINDENPALLGWYNATFNGNGRFNSDFYERVFDLLLRMKANYLWPAMWGKAFYADDPDNGRLADEYGIVMGTSHHEPMTRAQQEWTEGGTGAWDYASNKATLTSFWEGGIRRLGNFEAIVTVGMRGDGDEAGTANRQQLEQIITDQRGILTRISGREAASIPQVWTLYKEVQDYYDQGMRVPDDVTLMFADDNWGNIRKLPKPDAPARAGGYGVYYHFDYVGGPRNYKWINTNPIARVWEQMHLAYEHKATQIWIVNVGDIKPMEFPTQFFLDYAWNPEKWPAERLGEYTRQWAEQQFGSEHAVAIAELLTKYSKFNGRRKPELLSPDTYSVTNYREAERVAEEYNELAAKALEINGKLPMEYRDAYFQLVLFPVQACANLNDLYVTTAKNRLYATQGRAATNALAAKARELFQKDADLTRQYHTGISGGKWNHMMSQTHIGYTDWQEPPSNSMPMVREITLPATAQMGVAIDGSATVWPGGQGMPSLPEVSPFSAIAPYIDVFNRGQGKVSFTVTSEQPWLTVTPAMGEVETEQRLTISVDWSKAPMGKHQVPITVTGPNSSSVTVRANIHNPESAPPDTVVGSVETDGYVAVEAAHYTKAVGSGAIEWQNIFDLGRTHSGVTPFPTTAAAQTPGGQSPHLEYNMHLFHTGEVRVRAYISPTLNYQGQALRYAVSFDDAAPKTVNIHSDNSQQAWERWVSDNINVSVSTHTVQPGNRVLKFWMVDPGVVLQKLVVETATARTSYLGPPAAIPSNVDVAVPPPLEPGASGAGGGSTTGGAPSSGGNGAGGAPGPGAPSGGTAGGPVGAAGSGGQGQSQSGAGGASAGGGAGPVGTGGNGNSPGSGGTGSPTTPSPGAGQANQPNPGSGDDGGCGCRVPAERSNGNSALALLALLALLGGVIARRRCGRARPRN